MTRQEIITQAKDTLGEFMGTVAGANPFAWDRLVSTACDEVARATDCFYATVTTDVIGSQALYSAPQLYKVRAVSLYTADGVRHTLRSATVAAMDDWSRTWRDEAASAQPNMWIPMGLNQFSLYPAPNYSCTAGLVLEGYAVPGTTWSASSANCPLPDRAHMAVMYKACSLRIIQNPTPENMARRPMIAEEYENEKRKLEAEVRRFALATREPAYVGLCGGVSGDNPLDL